MQLIIDSKAKLNNGIEIPYLGLGTFRAAEGETAKTAVKAALETGYRHIDTAMIYGNERSVGEAIKESKIAREDIFVTTKLWNSDHGYENVLQAYEKSLGKLGFDYVDLYLVHWPVQRKRLETWEAMEALYKDGKCKAIGVSNYMIQHLEELLDACEIRPTINQIELSPYNYGSRKTVVDFCLKKDIQVESYSPLTKGEKLKDPDLKKIADQYDKTTAQILIRWALQKQFVVIPKSSNPRRIRENADVFDFTISDEDMEYLDSLDENLVTSWNPTREP